MNLEIEVNPIAIPAENYNVRIAQLVEHLLGLDDKLSGTNPLEVQ